MPVSWLLKSCFAFWLRFRYRWRKFFRGRAVPEAPFRLRGEKTSLPFMRGANLPWLRYGGDFGANAWNPKGGVGKAQDREALHRHLQILKERGIHVVRWFLFCDGRAGIRFSAAGTPAGPDGSLFTDIDAALETIEAERMKVIFVLLDFLWFDKASQVNGVQTGGRSSAVNGAYKQRALRRRVLAPLFKRYGSSPVILAWDIVNEPEWATRGLGGGIIRPAVSFLAMRRFIKRTVRLVHRCTGQLATVGLGNASGLTLVQGCGLDFYQVHWYDHWEGVAPLTRPVSELGLDRPLLLGEFPTRNSARSPEAIVAVSRDSGYCGAFAWSLLAEDDFSGIALDSEGPLKS
jgi:hypothetical protein